MISTAFVVINAVQWILAALATFNIIFVLKNDKPLFQGIYFLYAATMISIGIIELVFLPLLGTLTLVQILLGVGTLLIGVIMYVIYANIFSSLTLDL